MRGQEPRHRVRHCYKCLAFGHLSVDCTRDAHCGHCSEELETKKCPRRSTVLHFVKLRWIKLHERRRYLTGCLLFNIINTGTPSYMSDKISFRSITASHCTRTNIYTLAVPLCRTELYKASFCFGSAFWNSLPLHIRSTSSYYNFRIQLYDHLLRTYDR